MDAQKQKLIEYVHSQQQAGAPPESIRQQLLASGWDAVVVDSVMQEGQTTQTSFGSPTSHAQPKTTAKTKPPVAAQILYAFGFLGLIFGLFISVMLLIGSTNSSLTSITELFGISSLNIRLAAIVYGLIVVGLFFLVHEIRRLKKWALVTYSALVLIGFAMTIFDVITRSDFEALINRRSPVVDLFPYLVTGSLLLVLWIKNRKSFA